MQPWREKVPRRECCWRTTMSRSPACSRDRWRGTACTPSRPTRRRRRWLAAAELRPAFAVVDLRLPDGTGLQLVAQLIALNPGMRVIILTGHASIPSAVEAIKLGAIDYLVKPVKAEEVVAALGREGTNPDLPIAARPMSVNRVEWEHINRVLHEHGGNVSATARALSLHRRTLQRKLAKHPARV